MTDEELQVWFSTFENLMVSKLGAIPRGAGKTKMWADLTRFKRVGVNPKSGKAIIDDEFGVNNGSPELENKTEIQKMRAYYDAVKKGELFVVDSNVGDERKLPEHTFRVTMEDGQPVISDRPVSQMDPVAPTNKPNGFKWFVRKFLHLPFFKQDYADYERDLATYRADSRIAAIIKSKANANSKVPLSLPDETSRDFRHQQAMEDFRARKEAQAADTVAGIEEAEREVEFFKEDRPGLKKLFLGDHVFKYDVIGDFHTGRNGPIWERESRRSPHEGL